MATKDTLQGVVSAILSGDADEDFQSIYDAVKTRQRTLSRQKISQLGAGDRVIFNELARPKALQGVGAEVVKVNQTKIVVKLDRSAGRFTAGVPVTTPLSIVDLA